MKKFVILVSEIFKMDLAGCTNAIKAWGKASYIEACFIVCISLERNFTRTIEWYVRKKLAPQALWEKSHGHAL